MFQILSILIFYYSIISKYKIGKEWWVCPELIMLRMLEIKNCKKKKVKVKNRWIDEHSLLQKEPRENDMIGSICFPVSKGK